MADVFVSYKREDIASARRVVDRLRAEGRSVWWDDGLTPHEAWDTTIEREIATAKAVVVLWSPRAVASDWVRTEAHYAQEHGKLVPLMIERCTVPLAFTLRQTIDFGGDLATDAPGWAKLRRWLDDLDYPDVGERATAPVTSAAPLRSRGTWGRWRWAVVGALVATVLAGLGIARPHFWRQARPDVIVSAFDVTGRGLPPSFASDLHDEMLAAFSESSRISPREGDGGRVAGGYQLTGRIGTEGDTLIVYAKLYAPGLDAPILTSKLERPRSQAAGAPLEIGLTLASIVRCVATASDSSGSSVTTLPDAALKDWARFCELTQTGGDQPPDPDTPVRLLRNVVKSAPDFANGWANLAEALLVSVVGDATADRDAARREAEAAADRALAIDPATAKALVAKAMIALPFLAVNGPDQFPTMTGFARWQHFFDQALRARPSDCGCEVIQYGYQLQQFGRSAASLAYFQQGAAGQTSGWEADLSRADSLARLGREAEAKAVIDRLVARWPNNTAVRWGRLSTAIWRGDWAEALTVLPTLPANATTPAFRRLLEARRAGDAAGVAAAGRAFQALAKGPLADPSIATGLALADLPQDALDQAAAVLRQQGMPSLYILFTPPFDKVRRLPAFTPLVERTGLTRYWRLPGHAPDFCGVADPPPICATLTAGR